MNIYWLDCPSLFILNSHHTQWTSSHTPLSYSISYYVCFCQFINNNYNFIWCELFPASWGTINNFNRSINYFTLIILILIFYRLIVVDEIHSRTCLWYFSPYKWWSSNMKSHRCRGFQCSIRFLMYWCHFEQINVLFLNSARYKIWAGTIPVFHKI